MALCCAPIPLLIYSTTQPIGCVLDYNSHPFRAFLPNRIKEKTLFETYPYRNIFFEYAVWWMCGGGVIARFALEKTPLYVCNVLPAVISYPASLSLPFPSSNPIQSIVQKTVGCGSHQIRKLLDFQ